jgi:hypothetical protein
MLPEETGASKLIVNKQLGQWGMQYEAAQDLARIDLKKDSVEPAVPQFTISVNGGVLKLTWENTQFSVPFAVAK